MLWFLVPFQGKPCDWRQNHTTIANAPDSQAPAARKGGLFCAPADRDRVRTCRQASFASSVISALRTLETGQFFSASFASSACHLQAERERHGEAPGVSSGDQLLGVRAFFVFKNGF
jgi:hypothetical protein